MWGRLEWYYFIKDKYGDCVGIVEYLSEYAASHGTPEDVKSIGYVAAVVIIMLVALKACEIVRNPNQEERLESSCRRREHQGSGRCYQTKSTDDFNKD
jgi:hypothetical protein